MKLIKAFATLGILSPAVWVCGLVTGLMFYLLRNGLTDSEAFKRSFTLAILIYFTAIPTLVLFGVGVGLHAFVALRTQRPCTWAWWIILVFAVLLAAVWRPTGTALGSILVVLLFTLKAFTIMRKGAEPCAASKASGEIQ